MSPDWVYPTVAAVVSAGIGYLNHQKVSEVHVLVNSNMEAQKALNVSLATQLQLARSEIGELKAQLAQLMNP